MWRRNAIGWALAGANVAAFLLFLASRPPAARNFSSSRVEKRVEHGVLVTHVEISDAAPHLFAGRETNFHVGETVPVRIVTFLNLPALFVEHLIVDITWKWVFSYSEFTVSWIDAVLYLILSFLQWLILGLLLTRGWRLMRANPVVA